MTSVELEVERIDRIIRVLTAYVTGEKKYKTHSVKQKQEDKKIIEALNERRNELSK